MQKSHLNLLSRRSFLDASFKTSMAVALATLTDIPFVMKRALAEGTIGLNGKKILFLWLRGANDGLNSVIPVLDSQYASSRPTVGIPKDGGDINYNTPGAAFDPTLYTDLNNTARASTTPTYDYDMSIPLRNGFAGLHPSLKFLVPGYNAGDLALVHQIGRAHV